jgi:hypothetical protein
VWRCAWNDTYHWITQVCRNNDSCPAAVRPCWLTVTTSRDLDECDDCCRVYSASCM